MVVRMGLLIKVEDGKVSSRLGPQTDADAALLDELPGGGADAVLLALLSEAVGLEVQVAASLSGSQEVTQEKITTYLSELVNRLASTAIQDTKNRVDGSGEAR